MDLEQTIRSLTERGVVLTEVEGRLRVNSRTGLSGNLHRAIDRHHDELLGRVRWSERSQDYERRFGRPEAKLFPFLKATVQTVLGPALLEGLLPATAVVVLEAHDTRFSFVSFDDVGPLLRFEHPGSATSGGV